MCVCVLLTVCVCASNFVYNFLRALNQNRATEAPKNLKEIRKPYKEKYEIEKKYYLIDC